MSARIKKQNNSGSNEQQMDVSQCQIYRNCSGIAECRVVAKPCLSARYYRHVKLCMHPSVQSFRKLND